VICRCIAACPKLEWDKGNDLWHADMHCVEPCHAPHSLKTWELKADDEDQSRVAHGVRISLLFEGKTTKEMGSHSSLSAS
jgi:hypothetical protein